MVRMSYNNSKLMMLNIPNKVTKELLMSEVKARMGRGLVGVDLGAVDQKNSMKCALLRYEHHDQALEVRKMFKDGLCLWNSCIEVEWAESVTNVEVKVILKFLLSYLKRNVFKICQYLCSICILTSFQQNSVMYFKNLPREMTRWDLFDFLIEVIDIETALRMDIKQGKGYIIFHSEQGREEAFLRLKSKFMAPLKSLLK